MGMDVPWPEKMPMSTTWVFLGLLAGREVGIAIRLKMRSKNKVSNLIFRDAGKAFLGSALAVILALFLPMLITPVAAKVNEDETTAQSAPTDLAKPSPEVAPKSAPEE